MVDVDGMVGRLVKLMEDTHLASRQGCCGKYSLTEMVL
jgi:hypothetical protein